LLIQLFDRDELLTRSELLLSEVPEWLTPEGASTLGLLVELLNPPEEDSDEGA
jgi:hypothetical protein